MQAELKLLTLPDAIVLSCPIAPNAKFVILVELKLVAVRGLLVPIAIAAKMCVNFLILFAQLNQV